MNDLANDLFNDLLDGLEAEKISPAARLSALTFIRERLNDEIEVAAKKAQPKRTDTLKRDT